MSPSPSSSLCLFPSLCFFPSFHISLSLSLSLFIPSLTHLSLSSSLLFPYTPRSQSQTPSPLGGGRQSGRESRIGRALIHVAKGSAAVSPSFTSVPFRIAPRLPSFASRDNYGTVGTSTRHDRRRPGTSFRDEAHALKRTMYFTSLPNAGASLPLKLFFSFLLLTITSSYSTSFSPVSTSASIFFHSALLPNLLLIDHSPFTNSLPPPLSVTFLPKTPSYCQLLPRRSSRAPPPSPRAPPPKLLHVHLLFTHLTSIGLTSPQPHPRAPPLNLLLIVHLPLNLIPSCTSLLCTLLSCTFLQPSFSLSTSPHFILCTYSSTSSHCPLPQPASSCTSSSTSFSLSTSPSTYLVHLPSLTSFFNYPPPLNLILVSTSSTQYLASQLSTNTPLTTSSSVAPSPPSPSFSLPLLPLNHYPRAPSSSNSFLLLSHLPSTSSSLHFYLKTSFSHGSHSPLNLPIKNLPYYPPVHLLPSNPPSHFIPSLNLILVRQLLLNLLLIIHLPLNLILVHLPQPPSACLVHLLLLVTPHLSLVSSLLALAFTSSSKSSFYSEL
ncbi:hypothetical protein C7M84_022671 [Penaeus vannamei]|uniref:Uncharacterized protein n=1 Tax=Penaeus vannamei TaxID=6689 RepID=A0A3R7PVT6_PENVA|nr:hypothetical protein C7M84_022671 [Penaeus vannamei]